jgi:hypothetical protein
MGTIYERKSRIRFSLAMFGGFLVSLLLASRVPPAAQAGHLDTSAPTKHVPFHADITIRHYDSSGALRHTEETEEAFKQDGSFVFYRLSVNGVHVGTGFIMDAPTMTRTAIDPSSGSKTTYHLTSWPEPTKCASLPIAGTVLGIPVVKYHEEAPDHESFDELLAPALGCYSLQTIAVWTQDNGKTVRNETVVTRIDLGEPSDQLFVVPAGFTERKPSEVFGKESKALDAVYDNAQLPAKPR